MSARTTGGAVLVSGATGTVGRAVVAELLAVGVPVRAGVRDLHADLPEGAEPVLLDFSKPETAAAALDGADQLFLMRPPAISDVHTALGPLVSAAAHRSLRQVVVLSVMGVNPALPHWRMERMVTAAGLPMTTLRPAYFAQNLISAFGAGIRDDSQLRLAAGRGKVSFVDTRDVAAVAARLFTGQGPAGQGPAGQGRSKPRALTLTGPEALTFGDVAALLSAELGRPVDYVALSLLQRRRELRAQGAETAYTRVQLVIDVTTRLGLARKVTSEVADILGRPATALAEFIHDHRDAWRLST